MPHTDNVNVLPTGCFIEEGSEVKLNQKESNSAPELKKPRKQTMSEECNK